MASIGDTLRTSAFEQNITNIGATSPDSKAVSVPQQPLNNSSIVDINKANNTNAVARDAERRLIYELMKNPNDARRNNKIRLVSTAMAQGEGSVSTGADQVEFYLTPDVNESKQATYVEIGDIRQAASILIYTGSPSRNWSITAQFLSRTAEEAELTWSNVQLLRSWLNPDSNYKYGIDASGTPHVLKLYGYGRTWQGIPMVMKSMSIDYSKDVDQIPTSYGTNVPVILTVSMQLTESRTPDDLLKKFSLEHYKLGTLPEW